MRRVVRILWAAPTTAVGAMLLLAGAWHVRLRVVDGVIEAHGPALAWMLNTLVPISGGASAVTLGHVVIGRNAWSLEQTRSHERVHVRQCECWGPFFIPAYVAGSLSAVWRGRHYYYDNPFEREAFRVARK
jgi:hypothetical protein